MSKDRYKEGPKHKKREDHSKRIKDPQDKGSKRAQVKEDMRKYLNDDFEEDYGI